MIDWIELRGYLVLLYFCRWVDEYNYLGYYMSLCGWSYVAVWVI